MARECIENCWRIQQQQRTMESNDTWAGIGPFHANTFSGTSDVDTLLDLCEASYDCPGPGTTEVDVVKGFIRKRVETETRPTCGLPD